MYAYVYKDEFFFEQVDNPQQARKQITVNPK